MRDDDAEMTALFRDQLKQALEQQAEIQAKQVEINAKLDALIEGATEALIGYDAEIAEVLREAEAEDLRHRGST